MKLKAYYVVEEVVNKTKAMGFSEFEVGDLIKFSINIKNITKENGRGCYAPEVEVLNYNKNYSFFITMSRLDNILQNFKLEEI